uniref:Uncharacterized protein n=1 Tax=Arundo donax TaxID=35708 RepID=A0A0A9GBN8_ARUDO
MLSHFVLWFKDQLFLCLCLIYDSLPLITYPMWGCFLGREGPRNLYAIVHTLCYGAYLA